MPMLTEYNAVVNKVLYNLEVYSGIYFKQNRIEDLRSVGFVACLKAEKYFKSQRGDFTRYAYTAVRQAIRKEMRTGLIKLPDYWFFPSYLSKHKGSKTERRLIRERTSVNLTEMKLLPDTREESTLEHDTLLLYQALELIPKKYAEMLEKYFLKEETFEEMAVDFNCTKQRVHQLVYTKAIPMLKKQMKILMDNEI